MLWKSRKIEIVQEPNPIPKDISLEIIADTILEKVEIGRLELYKYNAYHSPDYFYGIQFTLINGNTFTIKIGGYDDCGLYLPNKDQQKYIDKVQSFFNLKEYDNSNIAICKQTKVKVVYSVSNQGKNWAIKEIHVPRKKDPKTKADYFIVRGV